MNTLVLTTSENLISQSSHHHHHHFTPHHRRVRSFENQIYSQPHQPQDEQLNTSNQSIQYDIKIEISPNTSTSLPSPSSCTSAPCTYPLPDYSEFSSIQSPSQISNSSDSIPFNNYSSSSIINSSNIENSNNNNNSLYKTEQQESISSLSNNNNIETSTTTTTTTTTTTNTITNNQQTHGDLFKANILVAEDDPLNRMIAVNYLGRLGHFVTLAEDGLQALNAVKSRTFDLILMDVQMPTMTGFEATSKIREYESTTGKRTPIIALTTGNREECLKAGMDEHLTKPAKFQQLNRMINSFLQKNQNGKGTIYSSNREFLSTSSPDLLNLSTYNSKNNNNNNNSGNNENNNNSSTSMNLDTIVEQEDLTPPCGQVKNQDLILNNVFKSVTRSNSEPCFFSKI
eukprot:gene10778-13199_t